MADAQKVQAELNALKALLAREKSNRQAAMRQARRDYGPAQERNAASTYAGGIRRLEAGIRRKEAELRNAQRG